MNKFKLEEDNFGIFTAIALIVAIISIVVTLNVMGYNKDKQHKADLLKNTSLIHTYNDTLIIDGIKRNTTINVYHKKGNDYITVEGEIK